LAVSFIGGGQQSIEYEADKLKISTNLWAHNSGLSAKAPSALLIGPDRQIVAFGYDAQRKYADIVENESDADYLFFQKFKMALYTAEVYYRDIIFLWCILLFIILIKKETETLFFV
jgi:hypothetical protein